MHTGKPWPSSPSGKSEKNRDRQNVSFALPKKLLLRQPDIQIQISEEQGKKYLTATTDRLACDVMFYLPGVKAVFTDNYKDLLPGHPFRTEIRTPLSKEEIEQQIRCRWVGK
ncbi:MAG: glycoside hydrolase family 2 protein [Eubacterium ramulus]